MCSAVASPGLPRLAALATIIEVARGQTFIHEGEPAEHFYVLIQGGAKLYKVLPDGRCQIIGFESGDSFLGLAASEAYAFSAEAIEPTRMCRLSRPSLMGIIRDFPALEQRLLRVAVHDLVQAQERMLLLGRMTAIERTASFLLRQRMQSRPRDTLSSRIRLLMSRSDIADYLGLNVETISRCLSQLVKRGVITVPNVHEVAIIDLSRLEVLAQGALDQSASIPGDCARREPPYSGPALG